MGAEIGVTATSRGPSGAAGSWELLPAALRGSVALPAFVPDSALQDRETVSCCFEPPSLWRFVMAAWGQ